jgi:hypothetical protein
LAGSWTQGGGGPEHSHSPARPCSAITAPHRCLKLLRGRPGSTTCSRRNVTRPTVFENSVKSVPCIEQQQRQQQCQQQCPVPAAVVHMLLVNQGSTHDALVWSAACAAGAQAAHGWGARLRACV